MPSLYFPRLGSNLAQLRPLKTHPVQLAPRRCGGVVERPSSAPLWQHSLRAFHPPHASHARRSLAARRCRRSSIVNRNVADVPRKPLQRRGGGAAPEAFYAHRIC